MPMTKPRDPDVIRRELLEAAIESYTTGGPFSVRDVAGRAGVNHAQIQHLFGGKDGLKRAMLEHLGRDLLDRIRAAEPTNVDELVAAAAETQLKDGGQFARALARHLLESPDAVAQDQFPVVGEALAVIATYPDAQQRRLTRILAERIALALGWSLFAPWIRKAMHLEDELAAELEGRIGEMPAEAKD